MRATRGSLALTALLLLGGVSVVSVHEPVEEVRPPVRAAPWSVAPRVPVAAPVEQAPELPTATNAVERSAYLADRVLVAAVDGVTLTEVAARHGTSVQTPEGASGFGALAVPAERAPAELLAVLQADPDVRHAGPMGIIQGTDTGNDTGLYAGRDLPEQWHLREANVPAFDGTPLGDWVVAVLDSGVAYKAAELGGVRYVAAPSLYQSSFVEPWDFVDHDELPLDEHQHGTHIASIIASSGGATGVAPGVSLMPVRVLDATNSGTELSLIEGLHHAAYYRADVVNMSLSFAQSYAPSTALLQALQGAYEAGCVMVASTGNDAFGQPSWPAASPLVVAVAAHHPQNTASPELAAYSNYGYATAVVAPGGQHDADYNGDGYVDGILAESIYPGDPSRTGLFFYTGTSQAAATVSGAAVWLLEAGVAPAHVASALRRTARPWGPHDFQDGYGVGELDVAGAVAGALDAVPSGPYHVAMLPFLQRNRSNPDNVRPAALVSVLDGAGSVVRDVRVYLTIWADGAPERTWCNIRGGDDFCRAKASSYTPRRVGGVAVPLIFGLSVDIVDIAKDEHSDLHHPSPAFFASDGLEVLVGALEADPRLDGSVLAFSWGDVTDPLLEEVAESLSIANTGTGFATSSFGVIANREALAIRRARAVSLNLDGTGLASVPVGTLDGYRVLLDGSGFGGVQLFVMDGTGLASSSFGFKATDMLSPSYTGYRHTDVARRIDGPVLSYASVQPTRLTGTGLEAFVAGGAWTSHSGYAGADAMTATGALDYGVGAPSASVERATGLECLSVADGLLP